MGRIILKDLGAINARGESNRFEGEISESTLRERIKDIEYLLRSKPKCVCYIMGMGAHPRANYLQLKKHPGVKVVWTKSILQGWWRVFSWLVASNAGLIKVIDASMLREVFIKFSEGSMVGIYIFDSQFEERFISLTKAKHFPGDYSFGLQVEKDFLCYVLDADNAESATGMYEIVVFGKKTSNPFFV